MTQNLEFTSLPTSCVPVYPFLENSTTGIAIILDNGNTVEQRYERLSSLETSKASDNWLVFVLQAKSGFKHDH